MQSILLHLFYLLIPLSHIAKVLAVPGCRSDRDKDHRPRENCTEAGFSDVQPGFPPTTKVLLFPSNLFSILSWSSFQDFAEIYEIDFTNNKIPHVSPSAAPVLPSLRVLRLGSNRLSSLPDVSFSACPGLTELYLHNNAIDSLSDNTFSGLSQLEILDLSSNRIGVLPLRMLHPLPAIETLYLESNKITVLPDNWFSQKEEVPYLYLSANPWACSCSQSYLHRYLNTYDYNIYVRDGLNIESDAESVMCDSPDRLKGDAVMNLMEEDLCPPSVITSGPDLVGHPSEPPIYTPSPPRIPPPTTPLATASPTTTSPPTTSPPTTFPTTTSPTTSLPTTSPPTTSPPTTSFTTFLPTTLPPTTAFTTFLPTTSPTTPSLATTSQAQTTSPMTFTPPAQLEHTEDHHVVTLSYYHPTIVVTPTPILLPVPFDPTGGEHHDKIVTGGVGVFCFWLFAACVLLCIASGVCTALMLAGLVYWYWRAYRPIRGKLAGRRRGGGGVKLLMSNMHAGGEQHLVGGGPDGVMALYRTVLFISREEREQEEQRDVETGRGGEAGQAFINLEPQRYVGCTRGGGETEERGMYKKTLYRVFSREEALEGWRDVMEEGWVTSEEGGTDGERRRGGGDGGVSRKRYSVILREEREEVGQRRAEQDWVVGGWEVTRGAGGAGDTGEGPRSSWGEWLGHYLPSIPWGLTTRPE